MIAQMAAKSGVGKKECGAVLDALEEVMGQQLGKAGPGVVTIPGLVKIQRVVKPPRPAATKPNPFKPGEMMEVKAKPASTDIKVRPLKKLKDMAS
jgi:nucleoid DNA-binding protein